MATVPPAESAETVRYPSQCDWDRYAAGLSRPVMIIREAVAPAAATLPQAGAAAYSVRHITADLRYGP
jgi:hypothetical protein